MRVGAATKLRVCDFLDTEKDAEPRLQEKGGQQRVIPCHHVVREYVRAYIEAAGLDPVQGAAVSERASARDEGLRQAAWSHQRVGEGQAGLSCRRPPFVDLQSQVSGDRRHAAPRSPLPHRRRAASRWSPQLAHARAPHPGGARSRAQRLNGCSYERREWKPFQRLGRRSPPRRLGALPEASWSPSNRWRINSVWYLTSAA